MNDRTKFSQVFANLNMKLSPLKVLFVAKFF
jgi:hypothetical protein